MDTFAEKVAVVTGAASGIGLALATKCAAEGMKVMLADVEDGALAAAESALRATGATVLAVRTNVMREEEVRRLADATFGAWGKVHLLFNNAGVSGGLAPEGVWSVPKEDWDWVLGVNFSGVLHGVRHFVPRMLASGEPGHVVNTASTAGLITAAGGPYTVSKHAVVALSEMLYKDLKTRDARVSASVLCPGWVDTQILESSRNRPEELTPNALAQPAPTARMALVRKMVAHLVKTGMKPAQVADLVFDAIRSDTFYIVPADERIQEAVGLRLEDLRLRRNPTIVPLG